MRQRQPRTIDKRHKGEVARLPCVICQTVPVHVAHVRYGSAKDDAPHTGMAEKPSDWRVVPLCPWHHLYAPDAQHSMSEREFWNLHGINPYALAKELYANTRDPEAMERLIFNARRLFPARAEEA